jgi:hypothetical protein
MRMHVLQPKLIYATVNIVPLAQHRICSILAAEFHGDFVLIINNDEYEVSSGI